MLAGAASSNRRCRAPAEGLGRIEVAVLSSSHRYLERADPGRIANLRTPDLGRIVNAAARRVLGRTVVLASGLS
jgi:hypothetical protein